MSSLADQAAEIVWRAVCREHIGRVALLSSFGTEAAVLLHMVAQVDPATPVLFINTGKLFGETLRYRQSLTTRLGLTDVREVLPTSEALRREDGDGLLFETDPDRCCHLRKVVPLAQAMEGFDALLTGRKRAHGGDRRNLAVIEPHGDHLKINPLVHMGPDDIAAYMRNHDLPPHPLTADGFASVGCYTCTTRTEAGEEPRAGRWRGYAKTECGIHLAPMTRRA